MYIICDYPYYYSSISFTIPICFNVYLKFSYLLRSYFHIDSNKNDKDSITYYLSITSEIFNISIKKSIMFCSIS